MNCRRVLLLDKSTAARGHADSSFKARRASPSARFMFGPRGEFEMMMKRERPAREKTAL
jgi:hypothetical protein